MRIFFAVPRSAWVDLNLRRSLEAMGHELVRFDFPGWPDEADQSWQRVGKPRTNERLLSAFRAARRQRRVDLFYGYLYSSVAYPATVELIRQSGVPTVNFSCNNVHQFNLVRDIAPRFDVCVVPERAALADFKAVGANPVRIQLAANPDVYRPYPEPRMYDVTFVGQRYADRAELLAYLARNGIHVRAWGAGWQTRKRLDLAHARAALALFEDERLDGLRRLVHQRLARGGSRGRGVQSPAADARATDTSGFGGPRLLQTDLVKSFSRSRVSLGFATAGTSHLSQKRLTHLRLREFEAPMSGALYLTEQQAELAEYFEPGKEVLTYVDRQELLDKARYYLGHQEESERIRRAGFLRARGAHTWQHRFRELFGVLGLAERT
ncbi:MAG: glycosyltransferase [Chloroflexota bacterium]|nr:glycosyltransferase [Chloroflexota bacterium]